MRDQLPARDTRSVEAHLAECSRCAALRDELASVSSGVGGLVAPALLGGAGAAYLLSGGGLAGGLAGGATTGAAVGGTAVGVGATVAAPTTGAAGVVLAGILTGSLALGTGLVLLDPTAAANPLQDAGTHLALGAAALGRAAVGCGILGQAGPEPGATAAPAASSVSSTMAGSYRRTDEGSLAVDVVWRTDAPTDTLCVAVTGPDGSSLRSVAGTGWDCAFYRVSGFPTTDRITLCRPRAVPAGTSLVLELRYAGGDGTGDGRSPVAYGMVAVDRTLLVDTVAL